MADGVIAADMDNDGDMDIVSASANDNTIAWYENDGAADPSWTASNIATSADNARSVFAADMDNDGDLDILSASQNDNTIAWYENSPAPNTPTDFVATPGNTQVVLTWTANSESDLASYKVYGGTSATPTTLLSTVTSGTETYTHSSLTNGTTYYYRISAVDNDGNEGDKTADVSSLPHDTDGSYSLSFDGVDDYVEINAVADDMAGLTDWAFSLWVKPEKASFPEAYAYILAINCDNGNTNCNKIMFGIHRDTGKIFIWEGSPGDNYGSIVLEGSATSDGDWNHIVYYRTGSTGTLYLHKALILRLKMLLSLVINGH